MKENKFRAWDKKNKRFVYVNLHPAQISWGSPQYVTQRFPTDVDGNISGVLFEDVEDWQEYTGLKDSKRTKEYPHGQEIYEGDVLFWDGSIVGTVSFEYAEFICGEGKDARNLCNAPHDELKIIGNIHENPERKKSVQIVSNGELLGE